MGVLQLSLDKHNSDQNAFLVENVITMVRPTLGPVLVNGLANSMLMVIKEDLSSIHIF